LSFRVLLAAWLVIAVAALFAQEAESHYNLGIELKKKGDLGGAKTELRRAIELNPKFNAARFYLAEILLDEEKPKEALEQLQTVPHSAAVDRLLALSYLGSGDPEKAAEVLRQHLTDAESHYYLGIALGQQGQVATAMREFKTAVAMKPDFGAAHESLGVAYRRQGDGAAALREFQLAARWMPKNAVTLCDLGVALKEAGKLPEAEQALRSALALKPDFERARYTLGIVLRLRGETRDATQQMQLVRESHARRTSNAQSQKLVMEAREALKAGRISEAQKALAEAALLTPANPTVYYLDGLAEEKLGNAEQAEALYNKAIALKADYAEAHLRLGILHARAKENDAALEELRIAVAADSDSAEAHYDLARLFEVLGRADESLSELQECLAIDPADTDARMLEGNLFAERRDTEHAVAAYEEVLRRKPDSAEAHNNLGLVWLNDGKMDSAQKEFRAALKLKPDYDAAQYNLNLALGK
jgi:Flp pilus assembly protein TadD